MELRPRQVLLKLHATHANALRLQAPWEVPFGVPLRQLRDRFGDEVVLTDPRTGRERGASLRSWAQADPDSTLISWSFHCSPPPRWLKRLR